MFVTDTHPLVWYATNKVSNLPARTLAIFEAANQSERVIHVPTTVLLECAMLEKRGDVQFKDGFERWANNLLKKSGFFAAEMSLSIISRAVGLGLNKDPFDKLIVATAIELDLPLITKDVAVTESKLVEVCW